MNKKVWTAWTIKLQGLALFPSTLNPYSPQPSTPTRPALFIAFFGGGGL